MARAFTAEQESPLLLQHEMHLVRSAPAGPDMHKFSLKANGVTREVVAVMEIEDGALLEMVIKLPPSSPLRRAEVTCRRRVRRLPSALLCWSPLGSDLRFMHDLYWLAVVPSGFHAMPDGHRTGMRVLSLCVGGGKGVCRERRGFVWVGG